MVQTSDKRSNNDKRGRDKVSIEVNTPRIVNLEVGDKVRVITEKEKLEGILMPSSDENVVVIKLKTGYNLGMDRNEVKEITFIEKPALNIKTPIKVAIKSNLPTIVVLHTGGTIASKVDYVTGGVTAKFTAEDLLEMFPELKDIANIETKLVSNMMSEDMMFSDYQKIARAIEDHLKTKEKEKKIAGFIIGHGTDTLGYSAAALSFMLEKVNVPVLFVGSQRSTDRGSSDAGQNLVSAAQFITKTDFVGVAICMHHSSNDDWCAILPGTKTRKMHTSRRDAFKVVNDSPIALVDFNGKIEYLKKDYSRKSMELSTSSPFILKDKFEPQVGLLKTHPQFSTELVEFYTNHFKGFVIEGTGLGHAPTNLGEENLRKYELIKQYIARGGVVAITSQCLFGRVHPNVYSNLRRLSEIGCIFCDDMLPETTFVKLAWLLGNYSADDVRKLMVQNLRGEINSQLPYEGEFLK